MLVFSGQTDEGSYSRIPKGKSLKFNWRWACNKPSGGEMNTSMIFNRLKDGELNRFSVGIPVTDWK
jgi:hypothetical protein